MKMKYEFSVRMQQRHLKAIVGSAAQALPSGHGGGLVGKRCLQDSGAGLVAEGQTLPEGCGCGLVGKRCLLDTGAACWRQRKRCLQDTDAGFKAGLEVKDGERKEGDSPVSAVLRV